MFDCCVTEINANLGNGKVVLAEKNRIKTGFVFDGEVQGGTLRVVSLFIARLVEMKEFVEVRYERYAGFKEAVDRGVKKSDSEYEWARDEGRD